MNILALEPFYRGSHKQFLDQFARHSVHDWAIHGLPGRNWRWRMRHAPLTFHQELSPSLTPDLLFCSSMFNLTEFLGLRPELSRVPSVIYFHENQLTYPLPHSVARDYHTVYIQFMSCLTATEIWFNSQFHQAEFYNALETWLKNMPDYRQEERVPELREKSTVMPPLIERRQEPERPKPDHPPHLLWVARMEQDKNFEAFHRLIHKLDQADVPFTVSVLGKTHDATHPFKIEFQDRIRFWGYQENRENYLNVLNESDIVISTADHEFFGLAIAEAVQAGCFPMLPNRLAYPEIYDPVSHPSFFYNDENDLLQKMQSMLRTSTPKELFDRAKPARDKVDAYTWDQRIALYDQRLTTL